MQKEKFDLLTALRITLIVLVIVGITAQQFSSFFAAHGGYVAFFYFTTQSNFFLLVINMCLLVFELRGKEKPQALLTLEHIAVSATTLTFFVFAVLLGPFVEKASYFYSVTNLTLHNAGPLLGIVTYLMTRKHEKVNPLFGLSSGLFYLVFAYTVYFIRGNFGPTEFPYFFLDFKTNGWLTFRPPVIGVIYYFVFIFFLLLGLSYLLAKLEEHENKQKVVTLTTVVLASLAFIVIVLNVVIKL